MDFNNVLNEIYSILKNKKDMVSRVELTEDFNISMIGFDGTPINYRLISEGEKGILMYSIMYALVSLAKFNLPLIIDSPLGKMDSIHVDHLMSYLYPNMGIVADKTIRAVSRLVAVLITIKVNAWKKLQ